MGEADIANVKAVSLAAISAQGHFYFIFFLEINFLLVHKLKTFKEKKKKVERVQLTGFLFKTKQQKTHF